MSIIGKQVWNCLDYPGQPTVSLFNAKLDLTIGT